MSQARGAASPAWVPCRAQGLRLEEPRHPHPGLRAQDPAQATAGSRAPADHLVLGAGPVAQLLSLYPATPSRDEGRSQATGTLSRLEGGVGARPAAPHCSPQQDSSTVLGRG